MKILLLTLSLALAFSANVFANDSSSLDYPSLTNSTAGFNMPVSASQQAAIDRAMEEAAQTTTVVNNGGGSIRTVTLSVFGGEDIFGGFCGYTFGGGYRYLSHTQLGFDLILNCTN